MVRAPATAPERTPEQVAALQHLCATALVQSGIIDTLLAEQFSGAPRYSPARDGATFRALTEDTRAGQ